LTASFFFGAFNTDQVTIIVRQCDIRILNSEGFKSGEDLIITLPYYSTDNTIEVFDVLGKRLFRYTGLTAQSYTLSGKLLPAGVYVIRVNATGKKKTEKVVKVR